MTNFHRVKIQNSNILNALIEHVEGKRDMSATQVTAGLGLLKKIMPDLAATADVGSAGDLVPVNRMTDDELEAIAAGSRSRAPAAPSSQSKLN
jgi:hypothetical protein